LYTVASGTTICRTVWPFKAEPGVPQLREEVSTLTRQLKGLKLDLDDLWDRFNRLSGRLAKRAAREDTSPTEEPAGGSEAVSGELPLSPTFSRLTPRQKQIQIQIMQRRVGNGGR
jgi:hypothetical protein